MTNQNGRALQMSRLGPQSQSNEESAVSAFFLLASLWSVQLEIREHLCICVSLSLYLLQNYGCVALSTLLICACLHCISHGEFLYAFWFGHMARFHGAATETRPPCCDPHPMSFHFYFYFGITCACCCHCCCSCCCCCYIWHIADIDSMRRCNEICCARQRDSRPSLKRLNNVAYSFTQGSF